MQTIQREPLPFTACFPKAGESPVWTPWAIRCESYGCREQEAIYLMLAHVQQEEDDSEKYYKRPARDYRCPRCQTRRAMLWDNPRPDNLELPVLNASGHAGHRALVDWFGGCALATDKYFAHDLAHYSRLILEEHGVLQFVAVARAGSLTIIGRGTDKAPERLAMEYRCSVVAQVVRWDGEQMWALARDEAEAWLCGEDENRRIAEVPGRVGTFRIPDFETLTSSLPWSIRKALAKDEQDRRRAAWDGSGPSGWTLREAYTQEVLQLVQNGMRCETPYVQMGLFALHGRQWVCHFSATDRTLPRKDEVNFHGHNTSQWRYAGALVVDAETAAVSTHH